MECRQRAAYTVRRQERMRIASPMRRGQLWMIYRVFSHAVMSHARREREGGDKDLEARAWACAPATPRIRNGRVRLLVWRHADGEARGSCSTLQSCEMQHLARRVRAWSPG